MARTVAHYYLYMLIFLHTFAMLLCVSTYINHGLKTNKNLEASVRSRIKRRIIPQVMSRVPRNTPETPNGSSDRSLQTLCSFHNSQVLCSTNSSSARLRRTVHSSLNLESDSSEAERSNTVSEGTVSDSPISSLQHSVVELGENLLNRIEVRREATIRNIQNQLDRWTNHERNARQERSTAPRTTLSALSSLLSDSSLGERSHSVSDHYNNTGSVGSRDELTRDGYHDAACPSGYCRAGICHYDTILSSKQCLCPRGRTGRRCDKTVRTSIMTSNNNNPYNSYSEQSRVISDGTQNGP